MQKIQHVLTNNELQFSIPKLTLTHLVLVETERKGENLISPVLPLSEVDFTIAFASQSCFLLLSLVHFILHHGPTCQVVNTSDFNARAKNKTNQMQNVGAIYF